MVETDGDVQAYIDDFNESKAFREQVKRFHAPNRHLVILVMLRGYVLILRAMRVISLHESSWRNFMTSVC
jgi:hypothetical protein